MISFKMNNSNLLPTIKILDSRTYQFNTYISRNINITNMNTNTISINSNNTMSIFVNTIKSLPNLTNFSSTITYFYDLDLSITINGSLHTSVVQLPKNNNALTQPIFTPPIPQLIIVSLVQSTTCLTDYTLEITNNSTSSINITIDYTLK